MKRVVSLCGCLHLTHPWPSKLLYAFHQLGTPDSSPGLELSTQALPTCAEVSKTKVGEHAPPNSAQRSWLTLHASIRQCAGRSENPACLGQRAGGSGARHLDVYFPLLWAWQERAHLSFVLGRAGSLPVTSYVV